MSETTGGAMRGVCQNCGADPRGGWGTNAVPLGDVAKGTCPACGRSLTMPFNRAMVPDEAPAVEYELDDWPPEERAAVGEALASRGIPFTWVPGLVLVVAAHREVEADNVFDELETAGPGEVSDGGELPAADDDWGEGEDTFAALGDLFDAADRLFHTPTGTVAANDLRSAGAIVRSAEPPYGFNPVLWQTAGELAAKVEQVIDEGGSNADIQAAAEALRDVLHEHI